MRKQNATHQDFYAGLIRLHILHHACEGDVFGFWMIEELGRHGYKLSPGTMYPLLHSLEERALLISKEKREGSRYRKLYRATPAGRKALVAAKATTRYDNHSDSDFKDDPGRRSARSSDPDPRSSWLGFLVRRHREISLPPQNKLQGDLKRYPWSRLRI